MHLQSKLPDKMGTAIKLIIAGLTLDRLHRLDMLKWWVEVLSLVTYVQTH